MGPGKGNTNNPNGRPKGRPNKVTQEKREKLSIILDMCIKDIPACLKEIRKDNPVMYVKLSLELASFVIPKKRDITSDDKAITPSVTIIEDKSKPQAD